MDLLGLSSQYCKLLKVAGLYSAKDIEDYMLANRTEENITFLYNLLKIFKLHDALYIVIGMISLDVEQDKFLDITEDIIKVLPQLMESAKFLKLSDRMNSRFLKVLDLADKSYNAYMMYFPKETRKVSLDYISTLLSQNFQFELHYLLDDLFDAIRGL